MNAYTLYGIKFDKVNSKQAVNYLKSALSSEKQTVVFTPNIQIIGECVKNKKLVELLNRADLLLPDGAGVELLCRKRGIYGVERITGIDTAYSLLQFASEKGLRVFLLGGKSGISRLAADNLKKQFPSINICGTHHGYFDKSSSSPHNRRVLKKIRLSKPDILFVCFGFPYQEQWIIQSRRSLPTVRLFMGLGGSLDVWAGKVRRAPRVFRSLKLEWLWRCLNQPKRFFPLTKSIFALLTATKTTKKGIE